MHALVAVISLILTTDHGYSPNYKWPARNSPREDPVEAIFPGCGSAPTLRIAQSSTKIILPLFFWKEWSDTINSTYPATITVRRLWRI